MKFSLATIALAAAVVASPTGNPPTQAGNCNVKGKTGNITCCNPDVVAALLCNILAKDACEANQDTYCCDSNAQGGLINVNLSCVRILS